MVTSPSVELERVICLEISFSTKSNYRYDACDRHCGPSDVGSCVDAALSVHDRIDHKITASFIASSSLDEDACCTVDPVKVGGIATAGHVIGSADEHPYTGSGGHLGVGNGSSCDTSGTCSEEPNTSGEEVEGEFSETSSLNGSMICSR